MVYGRYADSLFLDPVLNDANVDIWILSNLYDTLLLPTDDGKGVQPGLASAYAVAPDGMSVTLTLRDGTMFSDGSPITAEDVKWSLDRARDPKEGIWNFIDESIGSVDIKDPKTVVLTLKHPDPGHRGGPQRLQQRHHAARSSSRPCRARRWTTRPRPSPNTPSAPAPSPSCPGAGARR